MSKPRQSGRDADTTYEEWEDDTFDDVLSATDRVQLPPQHATAERLRIDDLQWDDTTNEARPGARRDTLTDSDEDEDTLRKERGAAAAANEADTRVLDVSELAGILASEVEAAITEGHRHIPSSELLPPDVGSDVHDRLTPIQRMPEFDVEVDYDPDSES